MNNRQTIQRNILVLMEWYDHGIRQGIGRYALEHNWHLTVDERARVPRGWEGDGILTVFHRRREIVAYLRRQRVPIVDMGLYHPEIALPRVVGDHTRIGALAAEHFADRGFRQTAWFSTAFSPIDSLRLKGFRAQCTSLEQSAPIEWVWEREASGSRDDWKKMRDWLGRCLLHAPKPIAVFAHNDYDAACVEDVCRLKGIAVPDDVAILGVDNNELVCLNQPVPLSSISHDLTRVGYEGAALLSRLIDGLEPPKGPILIPPADIALRQSTDLTAVNIPTVRLAMNFLTNNIGNSFGIENVAAAAHVSRSTLNRLFIRHVGRTVHAEVCRSRLACAKRLLLRSDRSIAEIARLCGFCHAQHLHNAFRRAEGLTPSVFRIKYGQTH